MRGVNNMTDFKEYEANQEDIDKVVAYLKTIDPEHATPQDAIDFLTQYQEKFHQLGTVLTDDEMKQLYDEFAQSRKDT
jgi:neutral trehalase